MMLGIMALVIMLFAIMLDVTVFIVMLSVTMLNVVMSSITDPYVQILEVAVKAFKYQTLSLFCPFEKGATLLG
jgi:hypothetical protein